MAAGCGGIEFRDGRFLQESAWPTPGSTQIRRKRRRARQARHCSAGVLRKPSVRSEPSGEAALIQRVQSGDHQAFAQLYSLHKRRIYSLCLRMVGNVAEAEDLTQETFLQLHRKISTFRGDSAFSTWLHRLAINAVLMQLRKKGLSLISMDEAMEPDPDSGSSRSFGARDPTSDRLHRPDGAGARGERASRRLSSGLYSARCRGL